MSKLDETQGPLRAWRYFNTTHSVVLECGHTKAWSIERGDPTRRVRCRKCLEGRPEEVSEEAIAREERIIALMKLPLPDDDTILRLLNGPAKGLAGIIEQAAVFEAEGYNLSVVAVEKAVQRGVARRLEPREPFSAIEPVGEEN